MLSAEILTLITFAKTLIPDKVTSWVWAGYIFWETSLEPLQSLFPDSWRRCLTQTWIALSRVDPCRLFYQPGS